MTPPGLQSRTPAVPHVIVRDFLGDEVVEGLLAYVNERESEFQPTNVGYGDHRRFDPDVRRSRRLAGRSHAPPVLEQRLIETFPALIDQLGLTRFTIARKVFEIVAHGDGAFYGEHADTFTGDDIPNSQRMLSCVYYFHRLPKRFTGGALRLYGFDRGSGRPFVDVEPDRDTLVAFPSFTRHEVLRVGCESDELLDSRFAINCWLMRRTEVPAGGTPASA
jgi:SM-20-related protein